MTSPLAVAVGPAVARERLRLRLRELRDDSGLAVGAVARRMDWSASKLSRIEKGDVTVQPLEVRALLALYEFTDEGEIQELTGLARRSRTRQWYSKHKLAGDFHRFVAYENEASTIRSWQIVYVPGLLQTREYATAISSIARRADPASELVQARVELRLDRQRAFRERLRSAAPPRLIAVLDESVLRRPVGGRAVMAAQLDHLLELAKESAYTFGITPLGLERHPGLGGTFELLEFAGTDDPDVFFAEAPGGTDDLRTDTEITAQYREVMTDLLASGLSGEAALDMIRGVRAGLA